MITERVKSFLAGATNEVPLEYMEYKVSRWMHWERIDEIPWHRVHEAITFMNIDIDHEEAMRDSNAPGGSRIPGGAVREIGRIG